VCATSPDRRSANHLSRICIRNQTGFAPSSARVFEPRVESAGLFRLTSGFASAGSCASVAADCTWCFRHEWRWILRRRAARPCRTAPARRLQEPAPMARTCHRWYGFEHAGVIHSLCPPVRLDCAPARDARVQTAANPANLGAAASRPPVPGVLFGQAKLQGVLRASSQAARRSVRAIGAHLTEASISQRSVSASNGPTSEGSTVMCCSLAAARDQRRSGRSRR